MSIPRAFRSDSAWLPGSCATASPESRLTNLTVKVDLLAEVLALTHADWKRKPIKYNY